MTRDAALVRGMLTVLLVVFCSILHRADPRPLNPDEIRWLDVRGLNLNPERNAP